MILCKMAFRPFMTINTSMIKHFLHHHPLGMRKITDGGMRFSSPCQFLRCGIFLGMILPPSTHSLRGFSGIFCTVFRS